MHSVCGCQYQNKAIFSGKRFPLISRYRFSNTKIYDPEDLEMSHLLKLFNKIKLYTMKYRFHLHVLSTQSIKLTSAKCEVAYSSTGVSLLENVLSL